jgi:O-antigen ligase
MLTLLNAAGVFGLALLAAIFISANRRATERKRRKKRVQQIKQRLGGEAIAS